LDTNLVEVCIWFCSLIKCIDQHRIDYADNDDESNNVYLQRSTGPFNSRD